MEETEELTVVNIPEEIELLYFPDEVLLNIMSFLNDITLLDMTRVCKHFEVLAKEAFAKKYNGRTNDQYFEVKPFHENLIVEREQYQSLFCTFGKNMAAIHVRFEFGAVAHDHWIFAMIHRFCSKLSKIKIGGGKEIDLLNVFRLLPNSSLTHLHLANITIVNTNWSGYRHPNLIYFYVSRLRGHEQHQIVDFVSTNNHLQEIHIEDLEIDNYVPFVEAIEDNCGNIRKLTIQEWDRNILWNREMINSLGKLTTLNELKINAHGLKLSQCESLVRRLTNLSVLTLDHTSIGSEIFENLARAISICRYITILTIRTKHPSFLKLKSELLTHIADDIVQANKAVVLMDGTDTIIIVKGEILGINSIFYKHDTVPSKSTKNFLDLNDYCLAKIVKYLKAKEHYALYDTCIRTRTAIEIFYSENIYYASFNSEELSENILRHLGKHIRSMELDIQYPSPTRNEFEELCGRINQYCTNLNELTIITYIKANDDDYTIDCVWPTLKKLKFSISFRDCICHNYPSVCSVSYKTLRLFFGPSLTHLEVLNLHIDDDTARSLHHGDHFRHLTVLKFGYYNKSVKKFLLALDDNICEQLQELSIGSQLITATLDPDPDDELAIKKFGWKTNRSVVELVSIVSRFRKLNTLQLIVPGVNLCNTKYLFQKCSNLVHFGVWCNGENKWLRCDMFKHVKDYCMHIATIRLFGLAISRNLLQMVRRMFSDVSVQVASQDNIAFSVTDEAPRYGELDIYIPEPNFY